MVTDQVQRSKGHIHDIGKNGLSAQLRWTMQKGGPMYTIRWGLLNWVTNIREVAEAVKEERRNKGACWEKVVERGEDKYMKNRGMLALAQWHGSHEEEATVEMEEGEFWDNVSGVPLKADWVKKARQDEMREFERNQYT